MIFLVLKLIVLLLCNVVVFKLEVIMIIVFEKLIFCFWLFVKMLLLSICNNILKIFGWVFLILLKSKIEYGLLCIFLVSFFFLL